MPVLPILIAPNPLLTQRCAVVPPDGFGPELEAFCADLIATMRSRKGVGLSAPQVGRLQRVIVLQPYDTDVTYRMVNPGLTKTAGIQTGENEGCLSVPGMRVRLARASKVTVAWQDPLTGSPMEQIFAGFAAVAVQHELDHLEGKTILDTMRPFLRRKYLEQAQGPAV